MLSHLCWSTYKNDRVVVHNIDKYKRFLYTGCYSISISIPKYLFVNNYPHKPRNLGEEIRKYRIDSGLQVKELAEIVGVTEDTIINWVKGSSKPSASNLVLILSILKHCTF